MSSLPRRMQRANKRRMGFKARASKDPIFGSQIGVHNSKAKDLLARECREQVRK